LADLAKLRVRVANDEIRKLAEAFQRACGSVSFVETEEAANTELIKAMSVLDDLQEKIGVVLRKIDDDEDRLIAA
jgi:hypothetical protein